jgi:hypothetical protein
LVDGQEPHTHRMARRLIDSSGTARTVAVRNSLTVSSGGEGEGARSELATTSSGALAGARETTSSSLSGWKRATSEADEH